MKAAVLHKNRDIRYEDYPTPEIRPGCVKVNVKATGICGSDIPRVLHNGAHSYPIVLGHEFAGEVTEIGEGVTTIKKGNRVAGVPLLPCMTCADCQKGHYSLCKRYGFIGSRNPGSFAEYVVLPEVNVVKFEDSVSYEHAAFFEPLTVALHGIHINAFEGGGHTAILGGGTIGLFTAMWCKLLGAGHVTVFDINQKRLELARELAADSTIDTREEGYMQKAWELTGGKGFSHVFETAGTPQTTTMAFEAASNKAHVCFIGTPHRDVTFSPKLWENMNRKEFVMTGSWMSYSAPFPGREWTMTAQYLSDGRLKISDKLIDKKFPLSRADEAFALFENPAQVTGKIMLLI